VDNTPFQSSLSGVAMSVSKKKRKQAKSRILSLETLEPRLMATVEQLENQLQQVSSPAFMASNPKSFLSSLTSTIVRSTPPTIARAISINTTNLLTNRTVALSALGSDALGESGLLYQWRILQQPPGALARFSVNGTNAAKSTSLNVSTAGEYRIQLTILNKSGLSVVSSQTLSVPRIMSGINVADTAGKAIANNAVLSTAASTFSVRLQSVDQFGSSLLVEPVYTIQATNSVRNVSAKVTFSNGIANFQFEQAGSYRVSVVSGRFSRNFTVNVSSTVTRIEIREAPKDVLVNGTVQFKAVGFDQFGKEMTGPISLTWSTSRGTISPQGLFKAPTTAGSVNIGVRSGSAIAGITLQVVSSQTISPIKDTDLSSLVTTYFADGSINREDMMAILRSTVKDGTVSATEFGDLQYIVTNASTYNIPEHVRNLAGDVVNGNVANKTFQGKSLGNLAIGSTALQMNSLVDKWFLGADLPQLTSSTYAYQIASGTLFDSNPSYLDQKQGALGDCYLIATLGSIAYVNPDAIKNMFIDNNDGTFTVRFFGGKYGMFMNSDGTLSDGFAAGTSGVADYITVDRRLPTYNAGSFIYSNLGASVRSPANRLWIALAEKAYAQWNETGMSGRNGTNTYAAIEGGWMATVAAQVLGRNSTTYMFGNTPKQTLINALNSGRSVTLGTKSSGMGGGLVGGHAYMVRSYNASNDTFNLFNPWGVSHPSPLTYTQLQLYCSAFVVANATGTTPIVSSIVNVRSSVRAALPMQFALLSAHQSGTAVSPSGLTHESLESPINDQGEMTMLALNTAVEEEDTELQMLRAIGHEIDSIYDDISAELGDSHDSIKLSDAIDELLSDDLWLKSLS
jgi:hypothetical protein